MAFDHCPIIVKCGTELLYAAKTVSTGEWPYAPQNAFDCIAGQTLLALANRIPMIIVSSGAVREGQYAFLSFPRLPPKNLYAGIGAPYLYQRWSDAFERRGKNIAQILVTTTNLQNAGERKSIAAAIAACHQNSIMPIINENDMIADREHCIGDNDRLAKIIAELTYADAVLFLTHVGGVYEDDPLHNPRARQYAEIDARMALTNPWLTRGMASKLLEAVQCFAMGMRVSIAGVNGDTISKFVAGEPVGTMIGNSIKFY